MRLVFMGSPSLACPSLQALAEAGLKVQMVVTQPDRPAGRGLKPAASPVATLAAELGLNTIKPEKIKEAQARLALLKPDFLVVVAFGQILPQAVLALAPAINLHTSLLPALRGAAPINRAIMRGLGQTGLTTMLMDQGLDTGPVLLQRAIDIAPDDTALSLAEKMAGQGPELLLATLRGLAAGAITPKAQDNRLASLAPRLSREEAALNWHRPAQELDWQTRGLFPWPGVQTSFAGQTIKLMPPTRLMPNNLGQAPGAILNPLLDSQEPLLWVACANGAIGFANAQAPGKKKVSGAEMARWLQSRAAHGFS